MGSNAVVGLNIDASQAQQQIRAIVSSLSDALGPKTLEKFNASYKKQMDAITKQTKTATTSVKNDFAKIDFKGILSGNVGAFKHTFAELGKQSGHSFFGSFAATALGVGTGATVGPVGSKWYTELLKHFEFKSLAAQGLVRVPGTNRVTTAASGYVFPTQPKLGDKVASRLFSLGQGIENPTPEFALGALKVVGGLFAIGLAIGATVKAFHILKDVVLESYQEFRAFNKQRVILRSTARNIGGLSTAALEGQAKDIAHSTGFARTDIFQAQAQLLKANFSEQQTLKLIEIATNMAKEQGQNVADVVTVLATAFNDGAFRGLRAYGIFGANIEEVQKKLETFYLKNPAPLKNRTKIIEERIEEFYIAIGEKVAPSINHLLDSIIVFIDKVPPATLDAIGSSLSSITSSLANVIPLLDPMLTNFSILMAFASKMTAISALPFNVAVGFLGKGTSKVMPRQVSHHSGDSYDGVSLVTATGKIAAKQEAAQSKLLDRASKQQDRQTRKFLGNAGGGDKIVIISKSEQFSGRNAP